jgi:hypothetical protein
MGIEARIVSDAVGRIADYTEGNDEVSIAGTIQKKDLYTFYAVTVNGDLNSKQEITLVLPVGGSVSGIYRFPRVGEKVLVEMGSTGNYLLGYIPNETDNPFAPVQNGTTLAKEQNRLLETGRGMALRYRQTGKKQDKAEPEGQYSEIGFYHEQTQWKPKSADDYADVPTEGDAKGFPKIDRINIQSTGDIYESAVNHHQVKAKRMEILVDCDDIDHKTNKTSANERPLGDFPGDDSVLHGGDAHIRAKKRVVIKAGEEIQLQVGRTVLTISDEGFKVITRLHRGNVENVYNTQLSIFPREGIKLAGPSIGIAATRELKLSDSLGGSFSSELGVMEIKGREIAIEAFDDIAYRCALLSYTFKYLQGITAGATSLSAAENTNVGEYAKFITDIAHEVEDICLGFAELRTP